VNVYLPISLSLFFIGVIICQFGVMPEAIKRLLWFNNPRLRAGLRSTVARLRHHDTADLRCRSDAAGDAVPERVGILSIDQ
jgi:hypothetical protein